MNDFYTFHFQTLYFLYLAHRIKIIFFQKGYIDFQFKTRFSTFLSKYSVEIKSISYKKG